VDFLQFKNRGRNFREAAYDLTFWGHQMQNSSFTTSQIFLGPQYEPRVINLFLTLVPYAVVTCEIEILQKCFILHVTMAYLQRSCFQRAKFFQVFLQHLTLHVTTAKFLLTMHAQNVLHSYFLDF